MKINLPQKYFSKLMRAVVEFDLIAEGDRILIGISGGKDSIFLAYALAALKERLQKNFTLAALTINPLFTADFGREAARISDFCADLGITHEVHEVDIAGTIAASHKNPCFTCAYFRRGAINRYAKEHSLNKIAYAHHHDDAVETFLMGLLYSGQLNTFLPKTFLDKTGLTVIRPLAYFREKEIAGAISYHGFAPIASPCPRDGHTIRQQTKELLAKLGAEVPEAYDHLSAAMRAGNLRDLWPAKKNRREMRAAYMAFANPNLR